MRVGKKLESSWALCCAHCVLLLKKCASSGKAESEALAGAEGAASGAGAAETTAPRAARAAAVTAMGDMVLDVCGCHKKLIGRIRNLDVWARKATIGEQGLMYDGEEERGR